ncbi:hypothetical protein I302_100913 [Kwoniella bestiolae CBS 10118]|uniref:Uncharacterized protein n=1 Tax=Kwoniella bestiolae CBS 10118 TaxID=1296100 RepID=A0A1B9G6H9_9TREE|nr:hypothetical protein I302_04289 [Kwoniella bestiolae CBS 10118]OCF26603.1 hypothetical protein I302_04289 [Kwoniella bestiolae CBS 10118]
MDTEFQALKPKPWRSRRAITSSDIASKLEEKLPTIVSQAPKKWPIGDRVSVQRIDNGKYDSFMKSPKALWPKGKKGVLVITEKSTSTINDEISNGGRLSTYGVVNSAVVCCQMVRL